MEKLMKDIDVVGQLLIDNNGPVLHRFFDLVEVGEVESALVGGVRVLSEMGVEVPSDVRSHAEELDRIEKERVKEMLRRANERFKR
ncbi:hypothetical protein QP572_01775 [Brevibacterium sp. UMB10442]|nr:hypothetical protein [Brevibacterium sp. UMB10442]